METMHDKVVKAYDKTKSLRATAKIVKKSEQYVRRVLIDRGLYRSPRYLQIREMRMKGMSSEEIAKKLEISKSAVEAYIPHRRNCDYGAEYATENALKIRKCRERKKKNNDTAKAE